MPSQSGYVNIVLSNLVKDITRSAREERRREDAARFRKQVDLYLFDRGIPDTRENRKEAAAIVGRELRRARKAMLAQFV
jgi:hypothetical protein